jgi:hypothetical protein
LHSQAPAAPAASETELDSGIIDYATATKEYDPEEDYEAASWRTAVRMERVRQNWMETRRRWTVEKKLWKRKRRSL